MRPQTDFSTLLASSVHDIKNSVGLLLSSLDEIIEDTPPVTESNKKNYAVLRAETAHINHALISLLALYQLDHQRLTLRSDDVMVMDFLEEQVLAQQLLFDINHIDVSIECSYDLIGYFDQQLVAGIIGNALVNAAKYGRDQITIRASRENSWLLIEVIDNGSGYPDQLVEATNQTASSIDFRSGSTNLGLYFAREIASLHENKGLSGSIHLCNTPEGGACFQLRLP